MKSTSAKRSPRRRSTPFSKTKLTMLVGAIAALMCAMFLVGTKSSNDVYASPDLFIWIDSNICEEAGRCA